MKAEWTNNDSLTTSQTTKAILVIDDMPTKCIKCSQFAFECCHAMKREIGYENIVQCKKPSWCPLKPMPHKMRTDADDIEEDSYFQGWNDCIEEIENESKECV